MSASHERRVFAIMEVMKDTIKRCSCRDIVAKLGKFVSQRNAYSWAAHAGGIYERHKMITSMM